MSRELILLPKMKYEQLLKERNINIDKTCADLKHGKPIDDEMLKPTQLNISANEKETKQSTSDDFSKPITSNKEQEDHIRENMKGDGVKDFEYVEMQPSEFIKKIVLRKHKRKREQKKKWIKFNI